jgi:F0F1-type ATP synthase alpha subunit
VDSAWWKLLKQAQYAPLSVERQVFVIYAGANGFLDSVDVTDIRKFEADMNKYLDVHHKELLVDIATKQALDDDIKARIGRRSRSSRPSSRRSGVRSEVVRWQRRTISSGASARSRTPCR